MTLGTMHLARTSIRSVSTVIPNKANTKPLDYCIHQVKKYDRENYLAALCIKKPQMKRVTFALRAFNVELSLVRDSTTNSDRAKQRFYFWSKLIEEIIRRNDQDDPNLQKATAYYKHAPVAKELLDVFYMISMTDEIKQWLNDMIGARVSSKVLGYQPFDSMEELELYCVKSNSSLYHLGCTIDMQMDSDKSENAGEHQLADSIRSVAELLGKAHGISNIIRGIAYNSQNNCCYIPQSLLAQHELTIRNFIGKNFDPKKARCIVEMMARRCQELLDQVHSAQRSLAPSMRDLFLPRVAIQSNLKRLRRCNYDVTDQRLASKNGLLPLNFWMASKFYRAPII